MMQIFVKVANKTQIIDVSSDDTLYDVAVKAITKFNRTNPGSNFPTDKARLIIRKNTKSYMDLNKTLAELDIVNEMTLSIMCKVPNNLESSDPTVIPVLKNYLKNMFNDISNDEIVFIGIGCFDYNHGNNSIKQQQCPDALLNYCIKNKRDLNIVLIDGAFTEKHCKQIYDIDKNWTILHSNIDNKIRRYKHKKATDLSACDIFLTVFSTNIPEYGSARKGLIAGINILNIFKKFSHDLNAFICGNFYSLDSDQNVTLGDKDSIKDSGFKYNPE